MGDRKDETRLVVVCADCGSAYAGTRLQNGDVQPIGARSGCSDCGGTEFVPSGETPPADDD